MRIFWISKVKKNKVGDAAALRIVSREFRLIDVADCQREAPRFLRITTTVALIFAFLLSNLQKHRTASFKSAKSAERREFRLELKF